MAIDQVLRDHLLDATEVINTPGGLPISGEVTIDTTVPLDVTDTNGAAILGAVVSAEASADSNTTNTIIPLDRNTELLQELLVEAKLTNKLLKKLYSPN